MLSRFLQIRQLFICLYLLRRNSVEVGRILCSIPRVLTQYGEMHWRPTESFLREIQSKSTESWEEFHPSTRSELKCRLGRQKTLATFCPSLRCELKFIESFVAYHSLYLLSWNSVDIHRIISCISWPFVLIFEIQCRSTESLAAFRLN